VLKNSAAAACGKRQACIVVPGLGWGFTRRQTLARAVCGLTYRRALSR
jgi:hypothetical protein